MKLHNALLLIPAACFVFPNVAAGQRKLTERDKSQIIQYILRRYDFTESETWRGDGDNTIYLLSENILPADIPSRKGLRFEIIDQDQIDRLRKTGVEYYRFSGFQIRKTSVRIFFVRTFTSAREGNDSTMEYTCRKVAGRWKLKARLDGVGAT